MGCYAVSTRASADPIGSSETSMAPLLSLVGAREQNFYPLHPSGHEVGYSRKGVTLGLATLF